MKKKLFVVSDVHGHYTVMKAALDAAGFDGENPEHLLVCCGDYFDRGDENVQVLRFFERVKHKVLLRGNHEDMLLKVLQSGRLMPHNYLNGTLQTIENFFGKYAVDPADDKLDFAGKTRTVDRLCAFIEETKDYFETEHYVFVHGWIPEGGESAVRRCAVPSEAWGHARWVRWTECYTGENPLLDKTLVCGHMPTMMAFCSDESHGERTDTIFYGEGLIAIDAGTYTSGRVNVLVLEENLLETPPA